MLTSTSTASGVTTMIRVAATIGFAVAPCSLGCVIIALSEQLIRAIMVGDDLGGLVSELQQQFPRDVLAVDEHCDPALLSKVVDQIADPARAVDLPLDVRGTDFQLSVWQALRRVPSGTTVSYTFLAKQIGAPNAVRAVAQACAANAIAVAIPCHRAVRSNGELSGYRWGIERKRALLDREAKT